MKNKTTIVAEAGKQELFIIREFDAPRELVFRAFTDPDMALRFFAPPGVKMVFEIADYRTGGAYRYAHVLPDGNKSVAFGYFHEVKAPEKIIQTFELEGVPGSENVLLETFLFEQIENNRTKLTIHDVCRSVSDRDALIESGMESGLTVIFDQLDELLRQ